MKKEQKMFDRLRTTLITYFEGAELPGNAVVLTTEDGRKFTKEELLKELNEDTEACKEFMVGSVIYTIELFAKLKDNDSMMEKAVEVEVKETIN